MQFTVRVKNPCVDSSFLGITVADGIADKIYNVGDDTPVTEVHSAPVVTGNSVVQGLCGTDLTIEAEFDGSSIDGTSTPVKYIASTRTFSIQDETPTYINMTKDYTLRVYFTNWPQTSSQPNAAQFEQTEQITFIDTCLSPFVFDTVPQTDPTSDEYSGTIRTFTLSRFDIDPDFCADRVTYECTTVSGPASQTYDELCDGINGVNGFDGIYNSESTDGKL